jgi:hypothetical protein
VDQSLVTTAKKFYIRPAYYPLFAIMTGVFAFAIGMTLWLSREAYEPNDESRNGPENTFVGRVSRRRTLGFHADKWDATRKEGIGVDHDEHLKSKLPK